MTVKRKTTLQPAALAGRPGSRAGISAKKLNRSRLSPALFNTVAAGAIAAIGMGTGIAHAQVVPGAPQCNVAGTTVTCTGDLSTGVDITSPSGITVYDTLNVNNADPVGGISFEANAAQDITINADTTGTTGISTSDADAAGIFAQQSGGDGDVTVNSTGNVTTTGDVAVGILAAQADGDGDVTVDSTGNVITTGDIASGILAVRRGGDGDVTVISAGNITTSGVGSEGIFALQRGGDGNVTVNSTGNITTTGDSSEGILALQRDGDGNVTVISTGNITTTEREAQGIAARQSGGDGDVTVNSTGNIITTGDSAEGIEARQSGGDGDVTVTSTGDISTTGDGSEGIDAQQSDGDGDVTVNSTGNITTSGYLSNGIGAQQTGGDGDVTVNSTGNITTSGTAADGIFTQVYGAGNITVTSTGNILAVGEPSLNAPVTGIYARVGSFDTQQNGNISISSTGNITATNEGITARIYGVGDITVHSIGEIDGGISSLVYGAGNITVTSSGNIVSDGTGIDAVLYSNQVFGLDGSGNVFVQSTGDITAGAEGINAQSSGTGNITVISNGNITAQIGIDAGTSNGDTLVVSSGDITSSASDAIEASTGTGNVSVQSSGNLTSEGGIGIDVRVDGGAGNITVASDGTITADDAAIEADHGGTGTINITVAGSVTGSTGILAENRILNAAATINSSATINGTDGFAIDLQDDGNDIVNLNGGSAIFGAIDFGNGNDGAGGSNPNDIDTLNVGPGVNAVLTFADTGGTGQGDSNLESAPENITGNVVLLEDGTTAVAVDPTGFATAQTFLNSITTSIFNAIDGIWQAGDDAADQQSAGFSLQGDGTQFTPVSHTNAAGTGHRFWGSAFGGGRDQEGSGTTANVDHVFGGLILGVEGIQAGEFRAGVFAGGGHSQFDVAFDAQKIEIATGFGGVYARQDWETHWLRAVVTGGFANHDSERRVANANIGGFETASADYDGYFIAPALTAGARLGEIVPDQALWGSVRVHYAGMFLDGYTESGVDAPLTVDDRDIHILGGRAQLAAPYEQLGADGAVFRFEGRVGVDAQFNVGGSDVETTVAGLPLNFTATFDDEIVSGFVGGSLARTSEDGSGFFKASTEVHFASDGSYELRGNLNAVWNF